MLSDLEAPAPPPQHWSWKKITLWCLGILVVFVIAIIAYDEKLEPYDDLMPAAVTVPDAKTNGYLFLKERWGEKPSFTTEARTKISALLTGMEPWDNAWIEGQRAETASALSDLKEVLSLPAFATPVYLRMQDLTGDSYSWVMRPFRLAQLEMETRRRAGDWAGAMEVRGELMEMIRRYTVGSHTLMNFLVAVSLHSALCEDTCQLLENGKLDDARARELAALWQTELPIMPIWREVIKYETLLLRNSLESLREGKETNGWKAVPWREKVFLKINKTINGIHRQRRETLRKTNLNKPAVPIAPVAEPADRLKWLKYLDANYYGRQMITADDGFEPIAMGVINNTFFKPRALRIRTAIHRWRLQHPNEWPATLQELVPDFLPEVPTDPWNGQPLTWDMKSKMITAVGSDWRHSPAKFNKERRSNFSDHHDNPALRLELPPPLPAKTAKARPAKAKPGPVPPPPASAAPAPSN